MHEINESLDLVFERQVDFSPEQIWKFWTTPSLLQKWFCPRPWSVCDVRIDLRPGGVFETVMQSPEGEKFPNQGMYLLVENQRRLVWTNAMLADFRPRPIPESGESLDFAFSVDLELIPQGGGTFYRAVVRHADVAGRDQHAAMGFQEGWGAAFGQLIELLEAEKA